MGTPLDDYTKMEVSFFDSKLDVVGAIGESLLEQYIWRVNYEMYSWGSAGMGLAEYDTTLLAWKEKVNHNIIRPVTVIKEEFFDTDIDVWAGPGMGIKSIKGRDFQSYMRTMPHGEYPSGSGCACIGLQDVLNGIVSFHMGPGEEEKFTTHVTYAAGSSPVEPGSVPAEPIELNYVGLEAMTAACGQSRINGGIHFRASVPMAEELCAGVGTQAFEYVKEAVNAVQIPVQWPPAAPQCGTCEYIPGMACPPGMAM